MSQFYIGIPGGSGLVETLSDDVGTIVNPNSSSNIQLAGHVNEQNGGKFSTVTAGTNVENINPMSSFRWIVDPLGFNGTHTTLSSAMTSSSSGDTIWIVAGSTLTENVTIKPGVNVAASIGDSLTPNVTLNGTLTMSGAGICTVSGINLQTNSTFAVVVSGSAASILNIDKCYLNCLNNTGISFSSSNSASQINIIYSQGNLATTGIALYSDTSAGTLNFLFSAFTNTGLSTTSSNSSAGQIKTDHSFFGSQISTSSTAAFTAHHSEFNPQSQGLNLTSIVWAGSGNNNCLLGVLASGTQPSVTVNSSGFLDLCSIQANGSVAIDGVGTLEYSGLSFEGSNSTITTSTQLPFSYLVPSGGTSGQVLTNQGATTRPAWASSSTANYSITTVNFAASPYTVLTTDVYLKVDSTAGAITLNFPNTTGMGRPFVIKDSTGQAAAHNITITTPGGIVTFDGSTSKVMNLAYESLTLVYDGSGYELV